MTVPLQFFAVARGDTIEQVRLVADRVGVTERTVWRWFAAMRASGSLELLEREWNCEYCGEPLPPEATIRRRFCDGTCRVHSYRALRRAIALQR